MKNFLTFYIIFFCFSGFVTAQELTQEQKVFNAQTLENQGKFGEAVEIYEKLYKSDPKNAFFYKLLYLYENNGDNKSLRDMVLEKLKKNPEDMDAKRYLARTYFKEKDKEKGIEILRSILKNRWTDQNAVNFVAYEFINQSEYDEALAVYNESRKKLNNSNAYCLEVARIYDFKMDYLNSLKEYIKGINLGNAIYLNIEQTSYRALDSGVSYNDISRPLMEYMREKPANAGIARILSELAMREGQPDIAYTILRDASIKAGQPAFLWNMAARLKSDGLNSLAIRAFEDYAASFKNDPRRKDAMMESASLKVSVGDYDGAKSNYQNIISEFSGSPAAAEASLRLVVLSKNEISFEKYCGFIKNLAETTTFREVSVKAYMELGDAYMSAGNMIDAKDAFGKAKIKARTIDEIYRTGLKSSMLAFYSADYGQMNKEIDSCVQSIPDGSEVNELLSLKILGMRCATQTDIGSFENYSKALYERSRGDTLAAVDYLTKAVADSSVAKSYAAKALGDIHKMRGNFKDAFSWYNISSESSPDTTLKVEALICAAEIAQKGLKDEKQAKEIYLNAITFYPGNVYETELRNRLRQLVEK